MEVNNKFPISHHFDGLNNTEFSNKCAEIAQDIRFGTFSIVQLIEDLENLLVNPLATKRELGVEILTQTLQTIPADFLNGQEIDIITSFYSVRLKDHHQVLPAVLRGILVIIQFKEFSGKTVPILLTSLFHNVGAQQQQQSDRYIIYRIFKSLFDTHKADMISMGTDLVYGIISSIDGERDPRNLLYLFQWLRTFLKSVPLAHLIEEVFEVMACYFPVDFRAPPSDINSISRDNLADALCPCLCAIPEFAEYAIPLALEKLDSSILVAKIDSLNLLKEGCSVFHVSSYTKYATDIWSQIQKEVFSCSDSNVVSECLHTLFALVKKLSQNEKNLFISILSDMTVTIKRNLLPDSNLFEPSTNILVHIALASEESAIYITKEIIPLLTNTFNITSSPKHKAVVLNSLLAFTRAYISQQKFSNFKVDDHLRCVFIICLKACLDPDNSLNSSGFNSCRALGNYLPLDARITLYGIIHKFLINRQDSNLRISVLKCFKKFAVLYPDEVKHQVLYQYNIPETGALDLYLNALTFIANVSDFREYVVDTMLKYITDNVELASVAIQNLKIVIQESDDVTLLNILSRKETIRILIEYVNSNDKCCQNISLLLNISSILKVLIGFQQSEIQTEIVKCQLEFIDGWKEELYIILLDGLLTRIRTDISLDYRIFEILTHVSITSENETVRQTAVELLANLINKKNAGDFFNNYLEDLRTRCLQQLNSHRANTIIALSWITKALVVRNHPKGNVWTEMLLELLEKNKEVAKGFRIIMDDSYESLSKRSYCNKSILYRQKFFIYVTDYMNKNYDATKESYLDALGYLLEYVPEQVFLLQFKKILKLTVLSLEKNKDEEALCVLLLTLKKFIIKKETVIEDNLDNFLLRILKLSTFKQSMKVRIKAIQCLRHISEAFPLLKLLPFKEQVLVQLEHCIDDKKRLVRKEAMETRSLWFLIDAPL